MDIRDGSCLYWLWTRLAYHDIKLRYRGSLLGPFWLTLSTAIMAGMMGFLYARLFNFDVPTYLPFVSVGLVAWQLISATINDGCFTFTSSSSIIQQTRIPYFVHIFRLVYRNLLVFFHNAIILVVVLAIYPPRMSWWLLTVIPSLIILTINGIWISCFLGMLGARYRDLSPIISNFLQVLFFITPVFWSADALGKFKFTVEYNPLFSAVDIMRAPLLGVAPSATSWPIVLGVTVFGCLMTFGLFARFRARIAYWI